jgi:hypothetical protein
LLQPTVGAGQLVVVDRRHPGPHGVITLMGDVVSQVDLPLENSETVSTQLRIAHC